MNSVKGFGLFFLSVFATLFINPAISQDETEENPDVQGWRQIQMPHTYKNLHVPSEFWQFAKEILKKDGASDQVLEDFVVLPVTVNVEIYAEDKAVLKEAVNYEVAFIEGGGTLDFFDFVSGKGQFAVRMIPALNHDGSMHLLYISDSPGKSVDGLQWGNGCGKIYDLSQNIDLFVMDHGMEVTSSQKQYMHLMAGTFVFMQLVDDRLYIGYIRMTDSRYPKFNCHSE